jgi:hypothetical protein
VLYTVIAKAGNCNYPPVIFTKLYSTMDTT